MKFKVRNSEVLHLQHSIYGAESWALRKVNEKQLKCLKCAAENDDQVDGSRVK